MNPMCTKRFSLRTLMIAATLAILFLGYAQWRKQRLLHECDAIAQLGSRVYVTENWLWPTVKSVEVKNTPPKFAEIQARAKAVGIDHVSQFIGDTIRYPDEAP